MIRLLVLVACLFLSGTAIAQDTTTALTEAQYTAWETSANRAETAVEEKRASNAALEQLRSEMAEWRARFQAARTTAEPRLVTLREQVAALGPPPEGDAKEPQAVANRRKELDDQIANLDAPRRAADEAYSRANNLVARIDGVIRERQASELLQLGPSPLNPANWPRAWTALVGTARGIVNETNGVWANHVLASERRESLPATLLLTLIAAVALLRGRRWLAAATRRVFPHMGLPSRNVASFAISFIDYTIPVVGVAALISAILTLNLFGLRGEAIVKSVVTLALFYGFAGWTAGRIFPHGDLANALLDLDADRRGEARFYAKLLGGVLWAMTLVRDVADSERYSEAARAVVQFPIVAIGALILIRLGALIRHAARDVDNDDLAHDYRRTLLRNLGLVVMGLAVLAVVATAVGYMSVPTFVLIPVISTLGLMAVLTVLQRFAAALYCLAMRRVDDSEGDDLVPVLIGLFVVIGSIPLFALIWGARRADLSEAWTKFLGGFTVGSTHVSPTDFLTFAAVFAVGYIATRVIQGTLRATVLPKTRIDPGGQNAIVSGLGYLGIFLTALLAITSTGLDLSSLAIVAGALSVGIGFGLQNIVSNFVAGIIMLIERPVAIGDWIEVGNHSGIVRDIAVRATRIETFDKTDVIVPNAEFISGAITNWTRYSSLGRVSLPVKVAGGNDSHKIEQILLEIAQSHPGISARHKPQVLLMSIEDALRFEIRAIVKDVNQAAMIRSDMAHEVLRRFAQAELVAPMPKSEVLYRQISDPPPLAAKASKGAATPRSRTKRTSPSQ